MKRTKNINLALMRKSLVAGIATTALAGCDGGEEVEIVTSVADCLDDTLMNVEQCRTAYQQAIFESERTAPKYLSNDLCESEFGYGRCERHDSGYFLPLMAGYLFANSLWDNNSSRYGASYNPVYKYVRPFSPLHNKYITADGEIVGEDDDKKYKMKKKSLKKKKSFKKAISKGGFGSIASKKSSFGKSSWGG